MKKHIVLLFLAWAMTGWSQNKDAELMKINGKPVTVQEFERMYTKNLDLVKDDEQKDIDNYKELFIRYKLELEDAYQNKYDTLRQVKGELVNYRRDLAKKYLSDEEIIDSLMHEAYERMRQDVRVAHILIRVNPDASAQDTLQAYKKIMDIYNKAVAGEDFSQLAMLYSEDDSAKENKGDLGYINVFHTVYPFETAAYTTPAGQISKPFRTQFGYHIVKVLDKRPAKGEIQVAHIMTKDKRKGQKIQDNKNVADAKTRIYQIYNKLKEGKDSFENLAKKYSDDRSSARYGGKLKRFGIRAMIPEFETVGFALQKEGDISEPFQTKYGWHIIQLIKKYPVPAYDQIKHELRKKIEKDERSKMGKEKLMKHIQEMFPVNIKGSLDKIYPLVNKKFFEKQWEMPQPAFKDETLFVINNDKKVTYGDFLRFLFARQLRSPGKYAEKKQVVDQLFDTFKKSKLYEYYNEHLEEIYPEFAQIMKEYKDGLMMFYIKSDKVWDKSVKDSIGLKEFFDKNREKYRMPKRYKILMVQVDKKRTAKYIKKYLSKGNDPDKLKEVYDDENLIVKKRVYQAGDEFIKEHDLDNRKLIMYKDGKQYMILKVLEVMPEKLPELTEVRGKVINDYQNYLEDKWLEELKKKYPVEINRENWNKLRAKYKK